MVKSNIHTVPSPKGGWDNKAEKCPNPLGHYSTKEQAQKAGKEVAQNRKLEHIIHGKDGKIQNSNSYGNDPCPPVDKVK